MVSTSIMAVGRAFGVENIGQIRQFVRAVKNGAPKATMHLDFSQAGLNKLVQNNPLVDQAQIARLQQLYPQDARNLLDIAFQRFGEKSGKVTLNAITQNANGENIAEGVTKLLANSAGVKVTSNASTSIQNMAANIDLQAIRNPNFSIQTFAKELLNKIKYSIDDGVAKIEVPTVKSNGVSLNMTASANKGIMDEIATVATDGKYNDYGALIQEAKNTLT